jgi:hypothetical protein
MWKISLSPRKRATEDGFNAVNLLEGWPPIRIVSPKKIIHAGSDES